MCRFWVAGDGSVRSGFRVCWWLWVCGFAGDGSVSSWLRAAQRSGTCGCGFVGFQVCWVAGLRVMGR